MDDIFFFLVKHILLLPFVLYVVHSIVHLHLQFQRVLHSLFVRYMCFLDKYREFTAFKLKRRHLLSVGSAAC